MRNKMYMPILLSPTIKICEACNFSCDFCAYADSFQIKQMDMDIYEKIIYETSRYNLNQGLKRLTVTIHGGEPLLCGLDYFEGMIKCQRSIKKSLSSDFIFENTLQTNGSLIDDKWICFFSDNKISVGISLDGGIGLNRHKPANHVHYSLDHIIDSYHKMLQNNIPCGILSVITDDHFEKKEEYYDFLVSNNIENVGLNYCFSQNRSDSVDIEKLVGFMKYLFDQFIYGKFKLSVREFDACIAKVLYGSEKYCVFCERKKCGNFLTFDASGEMFFCDYSWNKNRSVGNIVAQSLTELLQGEKYQNERRYCVKNIESCRNSCELFFACGGGCYRHDNESTLNPTNYFCKAYKQIYALISESLPRLIKEVNNNV